MRLNPIFLILAFTCAIYAAPLPDSLVLIAPRMFAATSVQLNIGITFNNGNTTLEHNAWMHSLPNKARTAEEKRVLDLHNGVKILMKAAFHFAIDEGHLKQRGIDPYDKIARGCYTLRYVWRNVPNPKAPRFRFYEDFTWFLTFMLPGSTQEHGDHSGDGSISRSGEELENGWGWLTRGVSPNRQRFYNRLENPNWADS
ncbi:hypothetical protein BDP27DRAFT_1445754 [Rhodocollybia butyracea]|uniref:Uncharacterized protein n=1 Tax=Rhodocollybia butyracea TaxID=206335 RepID=A0A9P5UBL7_9AGAR|nr:hypothetical protein BDP27DRAFT_1445754 [Rhodocollybia butyracea]